MVSPPWDRCSRAGETRRSLLDSHAALLCLRSAPTLRASKAPLLAIFGELDTPEGVKANVSAIRQILDLAGRRDYTVKVYPNGSHNLMEVPPDNPNETSASNDSHRVSSNDGRLDHNTASSACTSKALGTDLLAAGHGSSFSSRLFYLPFTIYDSLGESRLLIRTFEYPETA